MFVNHAGCLIHMYYVVWRTCFVSHEIGLCLLAYRESLMLRDRKRVDARRHIMRCSVLIHELAIYELANEHRELFVNHCSLIYF